MTVRKLSSSVRSKLQSGLTITDATQCTLELVENSLDAKATAIAVRVNLSKFRIEVVDNGTGISFDDLKSVGNWFMTSKCHSIEDLNSNLVTYGYRGQALASISEVCEKLTIKTKCKRSDETITKIFNNGEPESAFVSSKERSDYGTTVTVHGFMSTMPVRRKRISEVFDLEDIKSQMSYLAIIHNKICFTLRDENKGVILLQTHKKNGHGLSLGDLFGLASEKFLIPIKYAEKSIEVRGFVSLRRHSYSNFQFFYVNNKIVSKSMVHKLLNRLIDRYFKENGYLLEEMSDLQGVNLNLPKHKCNVFIVRIYCPYTYFVMFRNLRKTTVEFKNWDIILTCIKKAIKSTLCLKSSVPESNKVNKICGHVTKVASRNEQAEGNIKNGIKGRLVKRKHHCGSGKKENINEVARYSTESIGVSRNNLPSCKTMPKSKLISHSESHASECIGEPKTVSDCLAPKENYVKDVKNSVMPDLTESVHGEKDKCTECMNFLLDFVAWFQSKLKTDLAAAKIYKDFVEYKNNFGKREMKICSSEIVRKTFAKKLMAKNTEYNEVHIGTNVGSSNSETENLQRSSKIGSTLVIKQAENDGIKGIKGRKRNYTARNCEELMSKKLKVGENLSNNSLEDRILSHSQKCQRRVLSECLVSHQNHINLISEIGEVENQNSRDLKLDTEDSEKTRIFGRTKNKLKLSAQTQSRNIVEKGVQVSSTGNCSPRYKDFVLQTDMDFDTTPSTDKSNVMHQTTSNVILAQIQPKTNSSAIKDVDLNGSVNFEVNSKMTCHRTEACSCPPASLELHNLKSVAKELVPFSLTPEIHSASDGGIICERLFDKLTDRTGSEMAFHVSKTHSVTGSTNLQFGSQSRLVHTDPLNTNFNSKNGKSVSLEGLPNDSNFAFIERYNFLPKGLSQSALDRSPVSYFKTEQQCSGLIQGSNLPLSDFNRSEGSSYISKLPQNIFGELQKKIDENMVYYEKELITANVITNKVEILSLGSVTIDKNDLSNVTVVGQWDKKFILATLDIISSKKMKILAIFDQHAVDERIRLENLLKEFRTSDGRFVSVCCNPPIKCTVNESVGRLLSSFGNKLVDYGIAGAVLDDRNVLLHEIPLCFADENIPEKLDTLLQRALNCIVEEFSATRGTASVIPEVYYNVISTKACRSAVKFNDTLSDSAMGKMMNDLVACQIPFQCAHGRPCIITILDVEDYKSKFKKERSKLNFKKFSTMYQGHLM